MAPATRSCDAILRRDPATMSRHVPPRSQMYRFGAAVGEGELLGVAKAMNPSLDDKYKRPAVVVDKTLEDFRDLSVESLGKVKSLGHGDRNLTPAHVFGLASQR